MNPFESKNDTANVSFNREGLMNTKAEDFGSF